MPPLARLKPQVIKFIPNYDSLENDNRTMETAIQNYKQIVGLDRHLPFEPGLS